MSLMSTIKYLSEVPTKNWSESMAFAKERKCDLLPSIVKTQEREKYFNFTKSYLEIPFVLSTKSDVSFINNLSSLDGKKISIVKDYATQLSHLKPSSFPVTSLNRSIMAVKFSFLLTTSSILAISSKIAKNACIAIAKV